VRCKSVLTQTESAIGSAPGKAGVGVRRYRGEVPEMRLDTGRNEPCGLSTRDVAGSRIASVVGSWAGFRGNALLDCSCILCR